MSVRVLVTLAVAMILTTGAPNAVAQDSAGSPSVAWKWRRHHPADYAATGVFASAALGTALIPRGDPRWTQGNGFDDAIREQLVLGDFDDRRIAARVSDATLIALLSWRLVDSAAVTWVGHGAGAAAWQMAAIDLQALAFTLAATSGTKRAVERERPSGRACRADGSYDRRCEDQGSGGSFFSGHTSLAFTAAGLTCVHHLNVRLYGGHGDVAACIAATFGAASVGFERILADRHYTSDVLVGAAVGAISGAVLPSISFYAHPQQADSLVTWSVAPMPLPTGGALSLRGLF